MVEISEETHAYFNNQNRTVTTESSVLVSSSKYLNHARFRALIAQEYLRRNGPDIGLTGFIPEINQILFDLEDMADINRLFAEEKQRLPAFKTWLDERKLSDFQADELEHCAPGTLGAAIHDFIVNSGYALDFFFKGMPVTNDFEFYLKNRALGHDIEHIVTGFEPNHGGEMALIAANAHAMFRYFRPELAAFFNRTSCFLRSRAMLRSGLHYPAAAGAAFDADFLGALQGRGWKKPLMLVSWRDYVDWQIDDLREELGVRIEVEPGYWDWTNEAYLDPRFAAPAQMNEATIRAAAE